jgi:DNA-binding IclR family transcriptional regulator
LPALYDEIWRRLVLSQAAALDVVLTFARHTGAVQNRVGVFEPLYCTALGKALLAFQPEARGKPCSRPTHLRAVRGRAPTACAAVSGSAPARSAAQFALNHVASVGYSFARSSGPPREALGLSNFSFRGPVRMDAY